MLKNLKNLRKEVGLSQKQIAEILKVSQQTYSDYENCKTEPTTEILVEMASCFGVTVDELLGNEDFTPDERAVGFTDRRKVYITPIEDDLLYAFREFGKNHSEEEQRAIINMIEKIK